jgi:hypothetical protein
MIYSPPRVWYILGYPNSPRCTQFSGSHPIRLIWQFPMTASPHTCCTVMTLGVSGECTERLSIAGMQSEHLSWVPQTMDLQMAIPWNLAIWGLTYFTTACHCLKKKNWSLCKLRNYHIPVWVLTHQIWHNTSNHFLHIIPCSRPHRWFPPVLKIICTLEGHNIWLNVSTSLHILRAGWRGEVFVREQYISIHI